MANSVNNIMGTFQVHKLTFNLRWPDWKQGTGSTLSNSSMNSKWTFSGSLLALPSTFERQSSTASAHIFALIKLFATSRTCVTYIEKVFFSRIYHKEMIYTKAFQQILKTHAVHFWSTPKKLFCFLQKSGIFNTGKDIEENRWCSTKPIFSWSCLANLHPLLLVKEKTAIINKL